MKTIPYRLENGELLGDGPKGTLVYIGTQQAVGETMGMCDMVGDVTLDVVICGFLLARYGQNPQVELGTTYADNRVVDVEPHNKPVHVSVLGAHQGQTGHISRLALDWYFDKTD